MFFSILHSSYIIRQVSLYIVQLNFLCIFAEITGPVDTTRFYVIRLASGFRYTLLQNKKVSVSGIALIQLVIYKHKINLLLSLDGYLDSNILGFTFCF